MSSWEELSCWLNTWYHEPDLDALRLCLCAAAVHFYPQEKPLWLLLIGNSGSGKTEIAMQALKDLPDTHVLGRLTPSCFLSSREKGGRQNSLLYRHGNSQIWLFKDFTTFASMRFEARAEVAAQLREIWDGENHSDTGVGDSLSWEGKVTVIAAATPEFEEYWAALRNLGERFLTVRWHEPHEFRDAAEKVRAQAGHEDEIRVETRRLISDVFESRWQRNKMPTGIIMGRLDAMAEVTALMRVQVVRESDNSRAILRIPQSEFPTRIALALSQIVRTHTDLFQRESPGPEEFALARRLAFDTMPTVRVRILECVPDDGGRVSCGAILHGSHIPKTTLQRQIEELSVLGVLESTGDGDWSERCVSLTNRFKKMTAAAGITFQRIDPNVIVIPKRGRKASLNPDKAREYPI